MAEAARVDQTQRTSASHLTWQTEAENRQNFKLRTEHNAIEDVSDYRGYFDEFIMKLREGRNQTAHHSSAATDIGSLNRPSKTLLDLQYYFSTLEGTDIRPHTLFAAPKLRDALQDLSEVRREALDEGIPEPSNTAIENAKALLRGMYSISQRRFEVYPTPDAEVAIYAPGGFKRSVLVFCESEGGVLCMVNMKGEHRRARYDSARTLPDGFVLEALTELDEATSPAS